MKKLIALLILSAAGMVAQTKFTAPVQPPSGTVSQLPTASSWPYGLMWVTDGNSSTDCTTGSGSTKVLCYSTGSAWTAASSGGGTAPKFDRFISGSHEFNGSGGAFNTNVGTAHAGQIIRLNNTTNYPAVWYGTFPTISGSSMSVEPFFTANGDGSGVVTVSLNVSYACMTADGSTTNFDSVTYTSLGNTASTSNGAYQKVKNAGTLTWSSSLCSAGQPVAFKVSVNSESGGGADDVVLWGVRWYEN
jgi:hypothetical protein